MSAELELVERDEDAHSVEQGARVVVRLSRTATGTRTYTVGLSVPLAELGTPTERAVALGTLWNVEADIRAHLDAASASTGALLRERAEPVTVAPNLSADWATTRELLEATGWKRSRLQYHLNKLIRAGTVEKEQGTGGAGHESRYRLVQGTP